MVSSHSMIIYRFKKSIPFYKNRYLSVWVEEKKPEPIKHDEYYIKGYIGLIIIGPLIFIVLLIFFSVINFNIDWTNTSIEFLKSTIAIPIFFVSVIIPIVTLAISYIKDEVPDSFKRIYFGFLNPKFVFLINITFLAIFIFIFLFSFLTNLNDFSKTLFIIGLTSLITPIIYISMFVWKSMRLVIDEIPYQTIVKQMEMEIKELIKFDINNSLFRSTFTKKCRELNLEFSPNYPGSNYKELVSDKVGTLVDIDLHILESFSESIENKIEFLREENLNVIISVVPVKYVTKKRYTIGYVNLGGKKLENKLDDALIFDKNIKKPGKDLNSFKKLAYRAIENNEEPEFDWIIDVYMDGLDYYMDYMKQINVESTPSDLNALIEKWKFLTLTWFDLHDIIKLSAESRNNVLMDGLSYKLRDVFILAIKYMDFSVFRLLELFYYVYYYSVENDNLVGIDRSVNYLDDIIGKVEILLKNQKLTDNEFRNASYLIYYTIKTLIEILKQSIDYSDFKTYEIALSKLKLLSYINRPSNRIMELKKEIDKEILIQNFEAGSYIIKKINKNEFNGDSYKEFIELISPKFNNFKTLLKVINLVQKDKNGQIHLKLSRSLWERDEYPNVDGLFVTDTMGRILLFFCLMGIKSIEDIDNRPLNSSGIIKDNFNRIKNLCETIKAEKEKWNWLIDPDIDSKTDKFLEECQKSLS